MIWTRLPHNPLLPSMTIWCALAGGWQYVLGFDTQFGFWSASAKADADPDRTRFDIGWQFKTRAEAEHAVEQHSRKVMQ